MACSQKAIESICGFKISETKTVPEKSNPRANCDLDDWMELEGKNPVSILNELYPGILREYELRRNNFSENGNFRFESVSFSSFRIFCTDLRDVFRLVHKQIIK